MTEKRPTVIPKGMIFTCSTGVYSDYRVMGVFRAAADIDTEAVKAEWLKNNPDQAQPYHFDCAKMLAGVVRDGLVELVDSMEWHLEDGGTVDEMWLYSMDTLEELPTENE